MPFVTMTIPVWPPSINQRELCSQTLSKIILKKGFIWFYHMKTKPWRKCLLHNWFVGCPSTFVQVQTANWVKKKTGFQKPYFTFNSNWDFEYSVNSYLIFSEAITSMPVGHSCYSLKQASLFNTHAYIMACKCHSLQFSSCSSSLLVHRVDTESTERISTFGIILFLWKHTNSWISTENTAMANSES